MPMESSYTAVSSLLYLSDSTSPCSVNLIWPCTVPGGWDSDRVVGWTAATAQRAATAVEQSALDTVRPGYADDFLLGFVEVPAGGQNTAVLAGIGITQHDFLQIAGSFEQFAVDWFIQQAGHDLFDVGQVVNGFE